MGGSNNLFRVLTNPASLVLKDKNSFWFDPIGSTLGQGVQNWVRTLQGKDNFGEHKDWWGTGEGGLGNNKMREWTEGKRYKQWDAWEGKQKQDYAAQSAKYYAKPKADTSILDTHQKTENLVPKNMGTRVTQSVQDESLLSTSLKTDIY